MPSKGLHICLLSVHGLVRAESPELGRDADTGGQVLYVIELAKALSRTSGVAQVDLVTRLIQSERLSADYAKPKDPIGSNASIIRIRAGGTDYLPKEVLWDHLDSFADHLIDYYRAGGTVPDVVHSHYADAGYIACRMAHIMGIPLLHTGHSLGRVKRKRLIASGLDSHTIDQRYNMARRIVAEENTLAAADCVITSTHQEVTEQYGIYNCYRPEVMRVIPPGVDLGRFHPPHVDQQTEGIVVEVERFLRDNTKPIVLAISRADTKKNIPNLLHAYGRNLQLQELANLVLVLGNREDIDYLEEDAKLVLTEVLMLIDKYNLYGKVAYPKQHSHNDIPVLYRLAANSKGAFVNPAYTEPFGLTLIEAAASGLPIVATEDGGPKDIVRNCNNGLLVDPLEPEQIAEAIADVLTDEFQWQIRAFSGIQGVKQYYSWQAHAREYTSLVQSLLNKQSKRSYPPSGISEKSLYIDRALFTDLNGSLLGDVNALRELSRHIESQRNRLKFCITTGLRLDAALRLLKSYQVPDPDVLITSAGTEITFYPERTHDIAWTHHIEKQWTPKQVRRILDTVPGIALRSTKQQTHFKISYSYNPQVAPSVEEIRALLFKEDQSVNVVYSHGKYLNVVPIRASKGLALRYVAKRFGIELNKVLAIGGSAADEDMMRGNTLAAVVGNKKHRELSQLKQVESIYFTKQSFAAGIVEAMRYYDFLGDCVERPVQTEGVN